MNSTARRMSVFGFLLMWAVPAFPGSAQDSATEAIRAPKDFVLFFGLDVFVAEGEKRRPVVGASAREIFVRDEAGPSTVPQQGAALAATVEAKLSRTGATVDALNGYPIHSPATDPVAQAQAQALVLQDIQDERREDAEISMLRSQHESGRLNMMAGGMSGQERDDTLAAAAQFSATAESATQDLATLSSTPPMRDFLPGTRPSDGKGFDGFEVVFRVAASRRYSDAHGVVRLIVHLPENPGTKMQALRVFRLREVTSDPRKVVVRVFGLPLGFHVDSYTVHVYANGTELSTNLSQSRVELTEDEAHQYLILQHAQLNRTATIPAKVVSELQSSESRPSLSGGQEALLLNLRISAEGRVEQIIDDGAIMAALSTDLRRAVQRVRFLPALVVGKPAASTGAFALGELLF